jgi:hypothetical protein
MLLAMDTAKQSIARPMAISMISIKLILQVEM